MDKKTEDKASYILQSSTEMVSLNTMIPRYVRDMLEECMTYLQTTEPLHRYNLQKTTQLAIENFYQFMTEERARMDEQAIEELLSQKDAAKVLPRKEVGEIVDFPKPKTLFPSGLKMEDIEEWNKPIHLRTPKETEEPPRRENSLIRKRLGVPE